MSAIEGYPSSLYNLALIFRDKGLECNIPLAFTSSETLYEYQRALIEKVFHCQIFDHYGTTERTIRLEEDFNHNGYFESPGYGIEEYFDDYIISTSLINSAFPLIRYRTDDRIILKDTTKKTKENFINCLSCSKEQSPIKFIDGRIIAFIEGKDGTQYSDVALTFIFKDVAHVRKAQFIQKVQGEVDLNIIADSTYTSEDEKRILELLQAKVGLDNIDLKINLIKESKLIYSNRNKLSLVVRFL